jgi:DNA-binding protein H-NS
MNKLSVSAQIAKLRKERMAIERQEQALINKTYKEAIAQIKVIMKSSGMGLEDLVNYLEGSPVHLGSSHKASEGAPWGESLSERVAHKTVKGAKVSKAAKTSKSAKAAKSSGAKKPSSRAGVKVPIKYQHPTLEHLNWTGRGKTPAWVAQLREAGELETALVQKD